MIKKKELIIVIIILFLCVVVGICIEYTHKVKSDMSVEITVDGEMYNVLSIDEASDFTIQTDYGYNRIIIEDGCVWIKEADCSDHTCMNKGRIYELADTIICLPHKLCITIVEDDYEK